MSRLASCRRGSVVTTFALLLPVLAVLTAAGVELAMVLRDKSSLQEVADATALQAANEMALASDTSVVARAQARALEQLAELDEYAALVVTPSILKEGTRSVAVKIDMTATRPSFFGNLLPPGGFVLNVTTTARPMGTAPLCVFGTTTGSTESVRVGAGTITAGECLVHTNGNGRVDSGSSVAAASMQSVGTITGAPPSNALMGAKVVDDPFSTWTTAPPNWNNCVTTDQKANNNTTLRLPPGVHCGKLEIAQGATMILDPGVHYFRDWMQIKLNSRLEGDNATMVIGQNFYVEYNDTGWKWSLYGSKTGVWAGFAMIMDRARTSDFTINASMIERLEGVVYSPNARFIVSGASAAAQNSAWTVVVGKEIRVVNNANLFINANYANSQVPVPSGVGNKAIGSGGWNRLTQ